MPPRILIATTTWYAMPARLALSFAQCGAQVHGVFPGGSPLGKIASLQSKAPYSALFPVSSLKKAIELVKPDLIVPCDDRVIEHLHDLYATSISPQRNELVCTAIEQSLGDHGGYPVTGNRGRLLQLAEKIGIRVPQTKVIHSLDQLSSWLQEHGLPAVLKLDGTWGGSGVRVVRSYEEAEEAFGDLKESSTLSSFLHHISLHDFYPLFTSVSNKDREVIVQTYIDGSPANSMFACWKGEVLDALTVEVLLSQEKLGASTVVRTASNSDMEQAGHLIAKKLQVSGFFGLDFIVEASTGYPWLIELNPRATQIGHLTPSGGQSLVEALYHRMIGLPAQAVARLTGEAIAFFPQFLQCRADNPILSWPNIRHDVPWQEPALTRELMRNPWNSRHLSAWFYSAALRASRSSAASSLRRTTRRFVPRDRRL